MVSLEDLAAGVTGASAFIGKCFYVSLELSFLVGKTLVNQFLWIAECITHVSTLACSALQILCEDYLVFLGDAGGMILSLADFVYNSGASIYDILFETLVNVRSVLLKLTTLLTDTFEFITSTVLSIASCFSSMFLLIRNAFIIFGSSVWLCITILPLTFVYSINLFVTFMYDLFYEIQTLLSKLVQYCALGVDKFFAFFLDIPINSVFGCVLGGLAIIFIFKNFGGICSFIRRISNSVYFYCISFGNNLWTGVFLESNTQPQAVPLEISEVKENGFEYHEQQWHYHNDDKLCIICQDEPKQVIILPCKHMCLCVNCIKRLQGPYRICPICRSAIKRTMKVYV